MCNCGQRDRSLIFGVPGQLEADLAGSEAIRLTKQAI